MTATATNESAKFASEILTEDILSLSNARKEIGSLSGYHPDLSSMTRWCKRGVGGIKLGHVKIGNKLFTSRQAISRFIEERTAAE